MREDRFFSALALAAVTLFSCVLLHSQQGPRTQQLPQVQGTEPIARTSLTTIVIDPAHGGADSGARGPNGLVESEIVLDFARALQPALQAQGFRVLLTRQDNENPAFDDRSALANAQPGDVFITLHVSSTGPPGTARTYWYPLPPPVATPPAKKSGAKSLPASVAPAAGSGLLPWDRAQEPYVNLSHRLAGLLQIQLAQKFQGSPEAPTAAAVRQLRSVAAPAIAIEVSSVAVGDRNQLEQMAPALADAVARSLAAFRVIYDSGSR